jgi:protein involved in polysaccharide export with SLBB domain
MRLISCIVVGLLLTSQSNELLAQAFGGNLPSQNTLSPDQLSNSPSVYYYGQGQGVQIDINLWGEVKKTGKMIVPYTTDIISLISLAGGPTSNAKLDEVRIIRYTMQDSTAVEKIIRINVEKFVETGEQSYFPILLRGDTVIVPGGALSALQSFVAVIQLITAVLQVAFLYAIIQRNLQ